MIWEAVSLQNAASYHLCIMIQKGHSPNDQTESESWFWSIYNTETKETAWFMTFDKAKNAFLRICKQLLLESKDTENDFPW